ncbi:hypothetical protein ACQEVF_47375 [Nonomuraea polychroma]|uniref:hypothetical protein n=1 Tax=Nonomuraea polychroma TaxID=46176 RepID=UPI003D90B0BD
MVQRVLDVADGRAELERASLSASARARPARNASPFDNVPYGRIHAGGEFRPTAPSNATTSLTLMPFGKSSTSARSVHFWAPTRASGHSLRAIVDLPAPDGPTSRPTLHGCSSTGRCTHHELASLSSRGTSNMP